jgi:hypothetical protein
MNQDYLPEEVTDLDYGSSDSLTENEGRKGDELETETKK